MITDKIKELQTARAKLAVLEQQIAEERNKELAALPAQYGFASPEEFVAAVRAAKSGDQQGTRRGRQRGRGRPAGPAPRTGRRQRATITDETRAEVKKLVKDGKTGLEIAKAVGISLPSVQNIKKALGLVQKRK